MHVIRGRAPTMACAHLDVRHLSQLINQPWSVGKSGMIHKSIIWCVDPVRALNADYFITTNKTKDSPLFLFDQSMLLWLTDFFIL